MNHSEMQLIQYILEDNQEGIKKLLKEELKYKNLKDFIISNNAIFNLLGKPNNTYVLRLYPHINYENQLLLIDKISLRDQVAEYFTSTNVQDKDAMKDSFQLQKFLSYQIYQSNIKQIEKLQDFFGKQFLTEKVNKIILCDTITGRITNVGHKDKVFCPYYSIIYNFSMEMAYFLESQNITLPSVEQANAIHKDVQMLVFDFEKDFVETAITNYPKYLLHKQMQDTLPIATSLPVRRKI